MDAATTNATWGYKPDGSAEIFDLAPGEGLPDGWHASPDCITDPDLATAEALTARAEGRDYVLPAADPVSGFRVEGEAGATIDPDALANALAEIDRLTGIIATGTAENADLVAQIEGAEAALDAAEKRFEDGGRIQAEIVSGLTAERDALKDDLEHSREDGKALEGMVEKAVDDAKALTAERDALQSALTAAQAERDAIRADLEALTAPAAPADKPAAKGK